MYRVPLRINIGYDAVSPENIIIVIIDLYGTIIAERQFAHSNTLGKYVRRNRILVIIVEPIISKI